MPSNRFAVSRILAIAFSVSLFACGGSTEVAPDHGASGTAGGATGGGSGTGGVSGTGGAGAAGATVAPVALRELAALREPAALQEPAAFLEQAVRVDRFWTRGRTPLLPVRARFQRT